MMHVVDAETGTPMGHNPIIANERCDRCPARAITQIKTVDNYEIFLCGHHFRSGKSAIDNAGMRYYLTDAIRRDVLFELPRDFLVETDVN